MYTQYQLPYSFDALEPHIDALTMETHYTKHHAAYTKNLNDAAAKLGDDALAKNITALLSSLEGIEEHSLRQAIRNNGGGYYNHNLYFSTIGPNGGQPSGAFVKLLEKAFGSFSAFQDKLSALAMGQFGSGWAWLSSNSEGALRLSSSPNQDNPLMEHGGYVPILGIDVWEHAYYLRYRNLRADYVKAFFQVIRWDAVEQNYERVKNGQ